MKPKFLVPDRWTGMYAAAVAFLTYMLIFGYRKSFTVCTFDEEEFAGLSFKTAMVISQVLGYLAAKIYGIRYIAELKRKGRDRSIFLLVGIAWLSWLLFATIPSPWNLIFLFTNGFPLGMLWGIIFSYVEGRRSTDFIGAALAVSFIFSSGFIKTVGGWLILQFHISEWWVPFATGAIFSIPLVLMVFLMEHIPVPNQQDIELRKQRLPMSPADRSSLVKKFFPGLAAAILIYCFATIFRDIRDNFSADMWKELGFIDKPAIFSQTETPITIIILIMIGSMVLIKNNRIAFQLTHFFMLLGFVIAGGSAWLFLNGSIAPLVWMICTGLGLYMVYIPFNAVYFERLIAAFGITGNVGFLIYLADTFGYIGSVGVLLAKEVFKVEVNWVEFFSTSVIVLSIIGVGLTVFTAIYFHKKSLQINAGLEKS